MCAHGARNSGISVDQVCSVVHRRHSGLLEFWDSVVAKREGRSAFFPRIIWAARIIQFPFARESSFLSLVKSVSIPERKEKETYPCPSHCPKKPTLQPLGRR